MPVPLRSRSHALVRQTAALLLALALMLSHLPTGKALGEHAPESLDLAAMTLTPYDLIGAGLFGYGVGASQLFFPDLFTVLLSVESGLSYDEAAALLTDTGFLRAHYIWFYSPVADLEVDQTVASYVRAFGSAAGAARAWEILEDESWDDAAVDLPGFDQFGDRSEATLRLGRSNSGENNVEIDATVLVGNLHIGVSIIDWQLEEPDHRLVEELLESAIDRALRGGDLVQAALGNLALRLSGHEVLTRDDLYVMRDGAAIWHAGETVADADARRERYEAAGILEHYALRQVLAGSGAPGEISYRADLFRFESVEAAEAWFAGRAAELTAPESGLTALDLLEAAYGDEAFLYRASGSGETLTGHSVAVVRFGEIVAEVGLDAPVPPPVAAIDALTAAQTACLDEGGCFAPRPIPDPVAGFIDDVLGRGFRNDGWADDGSGGDDDWDDDDWDGDDDDDDDWDDDDDDDWDDDDWDDDDSDDWDDDDDDD